MKLHFDLDSVTVTEFGVGHKDEEGQNFVAMPVGADVQAALREVVQATWAALQKNADGPAKYEPSEKHGSRECLYLPIDNDLAKSIRVLHQAANLSMDAEALSDPANVFCYFTRLTDKKKRRLTALRRATQFKGALKSKNRFVQMIDDTLKILDDPVFKLDNEFDLLVDEKNVHILRPSGFESIGGLQPAILDAVPDNIAAIQKDLPFVAFDGIKEYARRHPRAARYLASIRGQDGAKNIDKARLEEYCRHVGVILEEKNGRLVVKPGYEMNFLGVLDRRLYEVNLVPKNPERYRAGSRRKING